MTRARDTSTSTRDAVAPPAWKKRFRTDPATSTRSPFDQVATARRGRALHTAQSSESDL